MKPRHLLLLLAGATALALPLSAQSLYGTDDFNDNTFADGRWGAFNTRNGGLWTEANGRLEFTADASSTAITTSNRAQQFVFWTNDQTGNTSYTDSWTATATITLNSSVVATNGVQVIGLETYMAGQQSGYYGLYLLNATSGARLFTEQGLYNGTTYTRSTLGSTGVLNPAFDVTDVTVRISYDGSTQTFNSAFSYDGGTTFLNYTTGGGTDSFGASAAGGVTGWLYTPTTGFGAEFYGALYGNGTDTGPIATSGAMYVDNFAVTAIPEPSTYAALAGLGALGLALWRRRARA